MSIRGLKKWALLLTFWVALQTRYLRATDLTGDNLTLTGTADIQGNTLSLGTGASSYPGWLGIYTDGTPSYVDLQGTRSGNIWRWWQNASSTAQLQMTLDNNNKLILYDQSSTPVAKITLDPLGASTFANSLTVTGTITVNGTNNQMPNQTLTGANSVLTEGLADTRYVSSSSITIGSVPYWGGSASTTSLNGGTATGPFSLAEGMGSTASGVYSTASGYHSNASGAYSNASGPFSTASGYGSTASGYRSNASDYFSNASGEYSNASGGDSTASGNLSTASGVGSTASGYGSTASGYWSNASGAWSNASGEYSTASGAWSNASGYESTASGAWSMASGAYSTASGRISNASGASSTASGYYSTASGYASMAIGNQTTAPAFAQLTLGQFNVGGFTSGGDTSWISTDPLLELGNGTDFNHLSDALVVYKNGNAAFQGVVTVAPGGDIPMYTGH